jgi:hypothetical protein
MEPAGPEGKEGRARYPHSCSHRWPQAQERRGGREGHHQAEHPRSRRLSECLRLRRIADRRRRATEHEGDARHSRREPKPSRFVHQGAGHRACLHREDCTRVGDELRRKDRYPSRPVRGRGVQHPCPRTRARDVAQGRTSHHGNASLLAESLEVIQQTSGVILAALQPPTAEAAMPDAELAKVA